MTDRLDPTALTPPIPPELRRIVGVGAGAASGDSVTSGVRGVGQPGKVGLLQAQLVAGSSGRTGLRGRFAKAPLSVSRPLYIDATRPHHAYLYTRTTGGGLAENDRVRQIVDVEDHACATVTTQAATNVHRMNAGCATQWSTFTVGDGAVLEYLPGHTTLFEGSRLVQSTEFRLAAGATLLAVETVMLGRLARGERHAFDVFSQGLRVEREGRPLLSDITCAVGAGVSGEGEGGMSGGMATSQSELLFGPWPVWTTMVVVPPAGWGDDAAREHVNRLAGELVSAASKGCAPETHEKPRVETHVELQEETQPETQWGVSTLVGDSGVIVRVAGMSTREVNRVANVLYDTARRAVLGSGAMDLRTM